MPTRRPNGASSTYFGADGDWHGRVTVGVREDGRPDRRHVRGKTEAEVIRKVRKLERERDAGTVRRAGQRWTVATWLTHWIDNIAAVPVIADSTHAGYRIDVEYHLIPGVGAHKLDRLAPEHLERLYAKMQRQGKAAGTANHVHRTIRLALNEAVRRGHLSKNPALLAKAPAADEQEIEPYNVDDIKRILNVAGERRNGVRWVIALALGLRQGEALGLQWTDINLETGELHVRRSRVRPKYRHGCKKACGRKPGFCPERVQTNRPTKNTKSRAGRRVIPLPREVVTLLGAHKERQETERLRAGGLWRGEGWVFAMPDGRPISPNTDFREWKALLKHAGVPSSRLHDARHSSATVLLLLGVPERVVMSVMGWSSTSMTKRYQHVTEAIRRQVADRLDGLLWEPETDGGAGK